MSMLVTKLRQGAIPDRLMRRLTKAQPTDKPSPGSRKTGW